MEVNTILVGNVLAVLRSLPDESIHCCITSPPYYKLRSYLPKDHPMKHLEIGSEDSPAEYIEKLVLVFREVRRVLRPDATLWLNLGDTYAHDSKWGGSTGGKHVSALHGRNGTRERRHTGFKEKDLMLIPARVAIALQEDGWWVRSDIIWHHTNGMPEPVHDRPVSAHEHIFLLAKNKHYYYDAESICDPLRPKTLTTFGTRHRPQGNNEDGQVKSDNWGRSLNERQPRLTSDGRIAGAHKRNVWPIASQASQGPHHATFPSKLIEPCVLAGTAPQCCEYCGIPWKRVMLATGHVNKREIAHVPGNSSTKTDSTGWQPTRMATNRWEPTCTCNCVGTGKCVVLDPFAGSGTTLLVSAEWQRNWIGIELYEEYANLAMERLAVVQPRLWSGSS